MGIGKQIVCTDQFSNFPEEAKAIPHVQDHVKVNLEELQQYKPEAIFTSTVIQQALATMMKTAGLPSIHQDPRTIEAIYETIREIGMIVDREPQAKELIARMHKGFQEVKKKAKVMREGRDVRIARLYIEEWPAVAHTTGASHFALGASRDRMVGKHDLPYASGNWVPEIARIAGGEQFPVAPGALSPEVTLEEVERWKLRDPIKIYRERLKQFGVSESDIAAIETSVRKEVDDATEVCKAAPMPPLDILTTDVYADGGWAWRN